MKYYELHMRHPVDDVEDIRRVGDILKLGEEYLVLQGSRALFTDDFKVYLTSCDKEGNILNSCRHVRPDGFAALVSFAVLKKAIVEGTYDIW